MVATSQVTVEELERMPLDGRYELIEGELVEMSPSGLRASNVAVTTAAVLIAHVGPRGLGAVFGADGGFRLFPDRETVRVPDVAFVRRERLPQPDGLAGFSRVAPDLVVEVVSPSDRPTEIAAKTQMYLEAGVPLLWLLDPDERSVTVLRPGFPPRTLRTGENLDGHPVLPEFTVPVADLFPL